MKGISIMVSLVLGILIIGIGSILIAKFFNYMNKQKIISQFDELSETINFVCMQSSGTKYSVSLKISEDIEKIYYLNEKDQDYLCIKLLNEDGPRCNEIRCKVIMNPIEYKDDGKESIWLKVNRILGRGNYYSLTLTIEKDNDGNIKISEKI